MHDIAYQDACGWLHLSLLLYDCTQRINKRWAYIIITSLSHHYHIIITSLSHHYHIIITSLSHHYHIHYHIIITSSSSSSSSSSSKRVKNGEVVWLFCFYICFYVWRLVWIRNTSSLDRGSREHFIHWSALVCETLSSFKALDEGALHMCVCLCMAGMFYTWCMEVQATIYQEYNI